MIRETASEPNVTPIDIATLHYHNARFHAALAALDAADATLDPVASGNLRVKCLIELDALAQADAFSRQLVEAHPAAATAHYYRGLVLFLQSRLTTRASEARRHYEAALSLGFTPAHCGLGLLAHAETDFPAALEHFAAGASDDPELENARFLKISQTRMALRDLAAAEEAIIASRRVLAPSPSLLRASWSELYWLRLLWARGQWQALRSHLQLVVALIDAPRMPRLYRCACEGQRWLEMAGVGAAADAERPGTWGGAALPAITSKPVLFELYEHLRANGPRGADKESIVERLWQEDYNPLVHDTRLYKAVARLRKILGDDARHPRVLVQKGRTYYLNAPLATSN